MTLTYMTLTYMALTYMTFTYMTLTYVTLSQHDQLTPIIKLFCIRNLTKQNIHNYIILTILLLLDVVIHSGVKELHVFVCASINH